MERTTLGRELADEEPPSWDELEDLGHRIDQWRKYNQTWLDQNLGGEAAEDYKAASVHWDTYTGSNPAIRLNALRKEIGGELSSLQSIHDRLHMWSPQTRGAPADQQGGQASLDAPIFIVHGRDTLRAESVARVVERATGRRTVILSEQANLGRTLIEKFEDHADEVAYAIIVITPDDQGNLAGESPQPRGRQNVIFELGYFAAALGRGSRPILAYPVGREARG